MNSTKELEMLDAILSATRNNTLVWTKESPGRYHGSGVIDIIIQEICPLIAGETETAGVQAFQVEVNRLVLTFWGGTDGCKNVLEILAAGLTEANEHTTIVSERISEVIEQLKPKRT